MLKKPGPQTKLLDNRVHQGKDSPSSPRLVWASHRHCHSVHRHLAPKRKPTQRVPGTHLSHCSEEVQLIKIPLLETNSGLGGFFFLHEKQIVLVLGHVNSSQLLILSHS